MNDRANRGLNAILQGTYLDESVGAFVLPLLASLNCAALLIDEHCAVLAMNNCVEPLLGRDLRLRGGRLEAADRASNDLMKKMVNAAIAGDLLPHRLLPPILIRRGDKRPLVVQVLPVAGLAHRAQTMLLLNDLDAPPGLSESRLSLLFGLTRAEARLAVRLGRGESVEGAADALAISIGTARSHLKATFGKTGTKRQAELVALLWRTARMATDGEAG